MVTWSNLRTTDYGLRWCGFALRIAPLQITNEHNGTGGGGTLLTADVNYVFIRDLINNQGVRCYYPICCVLLESGRGYNDTRLR